MNNGTRILAALATIIGLAFSAAGAAAQVADDSSSDSSTTCVTADLGGQQLQVGLADRTTAVAIELPAGTIEISSARATDGYPNRVNVEQNSEKYEIEFISASGEVIAVSAPTEDVPDLLEFGEWIGPLGAVELSEPVVAIRAHHRPDLPGDGSPESVRANEVTFCYEVTAPPTTTTTTPVCGDDGVTTNPDGTPCQPVCGDEGVTTNPDGTPCTTTTTELACGDDGVTTNPDGTPCQPVCGDDGVTTNPDGTPCQPVCGDEGVTTNPDGTPCTTTTTEGESTSPTVTTVPASSTTTNDEEVAGPTSSTSAPASTTTTAVESTTTTAAEEVAGPTSSELPLTGSNSALLLTFGGFMILAGGALALTGRPTD